MKKTFQKKNPFTCPVCNTKAYQEELLTGRGRIIADGLSIELHRFYKASTKWGKPYPLIYPVVVCPKCSYAAYHFDFEHKIAGRKKFEDFVKDSPVRAKEVRQIFPDFDFTKSERTLVEGIASYILAIHCYKMQPPELNPTFAIARSALRCAWLIQDMIDDKLSNIEPAKLNKVQKHFYKIAAKYYSLTLEKEQTGEENLARLKNLGPDTDKDFAFEGVKYLHCILNYRMCFFESDIEKRIEKFRLAKSLVSSIFGFGNVSKDKPGALLQMAKLITRKIGNKINEYETKNQKGIPIDEDYIVIDVIPDNELEEEMRFDYVKSIHS
jgi:uncharacterized protein